MCTILIAEKGIKIKNLLCLVALSDLVFLRKHKVNTMENTWFKWTFTRYPFSLSIFSSHFTLRLPESRGNFVLHNSFFSFEWYSKQRRYLPAQRVIFNEKHFRILFIIESFMRYQHEMRPYRRTPNQNANETENKRLQYFGIWIQRKQA